MSRPLSATSRLRRATAVAASAVAVLVGLGAGPAAAGDDHAGGVSGSRESIDRGEPSSEVAGVTVSRPDARESEFAFTGSDLLGLAAIGGAALAAGVGASKLSKRRSSRASS